MSRPTIRSLYPIILCSLVGVLVATPALAYVDPNATGLITQVLGPVLVIAATAATFLRKQMVSAFHWVTGRITTKK